MITKLASDFSCEELGNEPQSLVDKPEAGCCVTADEATMIITRIFGDDHGESHFSDIDVPLTLIVPARGLPPMAMSPPIASTQVRFRVGAPALIAHEWRPAPARQFVIFSEGSLEVEVSDGHRRKFGPALSRWSKTHRVKDTKITSSTTTSFFWSSPLSRIK